MDARLEIRTFGGLSITLDQTSPRFVSRKAEALLAYLACERRAYSREVLAEMLWPERPQGQARSNLRVALNSLARHLDTFILRAGDTLQLRHDDGLWVDSTAFRACLDLAPSPAQFEAAANLYHGDFLAGFYLDDCPEFEQWMLREQQHLRRRVLNVLDTLVDHCLASADYETGLQHAYAVLRIDPEREPTYRSLMLLLALSGQRRAAIEQYRQCADSLAVYGMKPAADTAALLSAIRDGHALDTFVPPAPFAPPPPPPTTGLWPGKPTATPFQAPPRSAHFVGRADDLTRLNEALTHPQPPARYALVGMGGIGKTTLAAQLAHRLRGYFDGGVLWADLAASDPMAILQSWALAFGEDFSLMRSLTARMTAFRDLVHNRRVLIVLDDVAYLSDARPLLPPESSCVTLVTTRSREVATALNAQVIAVPPLADAESVDMLRLILGEQRVQHEPEAARAIVALVDNLPLAVEVVGQRAKTRPRHKLAHWLTRLQQAALDTLQISDQAVSASLALSWDILTGETQAVFRSLAVFATRHFTLEAAVTLLGDAPGVDPVDALDELSDLSLLHEDGPAHYHLHALLADFAQIKLEAAGDDVIETAYRRMADYYCAFTAQHQTDYPVLEREWLNIHAGFAAAYAREWWPLCIDYARFLRDLWCDRGRYSEAREGFNWALRAAEALRDRPQQADILRCWGEACIEQNDYAEARDHLLHSQRLCQRIKDPGGEAAVLALLGRIAIQQEQLDDAHDLLTESCRLYAQVDDTAGLAYAQYLSAEIPFYRGDLAAAKQQAAGALLRQEAVNDHTGCVRTLNLLLNIAVWEGDYQQAIHYGETALHLCDLREELADRAMTLQDLAGAYSRDNQLQKALDTITEGVDLLRRIGDRLMLVQALRQQGQIYRRLQDYGQAQAVFDRGLALSQELDHKGEQGYMLASMGGLYADQGHVVQALEVWHAARALLAQSDYPPAPGLDDRIAQYSGAADAPD
jgi:DNA-binding SARP family transcriptional activator/predicted ATPase/tetratricopeptide (TPR) repeat protein